MPPLILIVDDDPVQRRLIETLLERLGYRTLALPGGGAALDRLADLAGEPPAAIFLDLVMPGIDGMEVLETLRKRGRDIPVIVQTAHGGIDTVVRAMRAGAVDFVVKPVSPERLQVSLENALRLEALEGEVARFKRSAAGTLGFADIITRSPAMQEAIRLGERAARSSIPILIEGESGVGKELIARAIQGSSERRAKPFVTVNCGAIPQNLVESILFGHEKGAFTGASDRHIGKFREASGGTLFLDEIGELPLDAQVKVLRALQDGEIDPVGSRKSTHTDFRLISATNQNLSDLMRTGRFREDLFYRLNAFPIRLPPLRERREDIPELARHFTMRFAAEERRREIRGIGAEAVALLSAFDWPGNIRQLENAVFRAVVLANGPTLTPAEFPQIAALVRPDLAASAPPSAERHPGGPGNPDDAPGEWIAATTLAGDVRPLAAIEADAIRLALQHYDGRMALVARRLGMGRSTLYRKLKEMGVEVTVGEELAR